jgi:cytoskeletal protein CcmA (bactofilin family)
MKVFGIGEDRDKEQQTTSIIGREMALVGNVTFKGRLRLDGRIEGNVKGEHLVLGATGKVIGNVTAANLVCHGHVEGNVDAKKLHVMRGGTITGKVETTDLSVESGALLNGEIKSRSQDLRLIPGSSIPEIEWSEKVGAALKEK